MAERVWDRFLTDQDRQHVGRLPAARMGVGKRPALLLVDLYRWVFGDKPEPLMEAIETWPSSCGMAGWDALPHIQRLLAEARRLGIPVIHTTTLESVPSWNDGVLRGNAVDAPELRARRARGNQIIDEVAPIPGEMTILKSAPSAFWGTPLAGVLTGLGVDTVIVAGESTSGCVRASVVDGKTSRLKMVIPEECVFDRHEATHALNLFDLEQKYADVIPLDEVIAYLRSTADSGL